MRKLLLFFTFSFSFFTCVVSAQELKPKQITPIYRRSFTATYDLTGDRPVREAALSPDKTRVAFVRDNNLFVKNLTTGAQTAITTDGRRNEIINGATDWVYEEEYAFTRAWEFSPDSRRIAWLRFDEREVREFSMMRYDERLYPQAYTFKYPKAGEENSVVSLHIYDLITGEIKTIPTGHETDQYLPRIGWTPSGELYFYKINRLQNHFEVVLEDGRVIYEETSPKYVERPDYKTITFIDEDRFIAKNETRTGWMHLYLHSIAHGPLGAITSGPWEVTELQGIRDGRVWYVSTELGELTRSTWSVRIDGGDRRVENPRPGQPTASLTTSPDNREFFSFTTPEGIKLNGWILRPADFDPARKYPVLVTQYSGPGSVSVSYQPISGGDRAIYDPLLEAGYIVACVDPRGTGGRGEEFKKSTYGKLGKLETEDQIAAARHLATLPFVDPARIGIYGWSYGGFIALNSILKGADVFKAAVAVAPVTSWRFYDTIYTEIYNGLPADNPSGYDDNSPLNYAHLLQGNLLMIHGTGDDNVHVQNTLEMAKALTRAGRQFDMMIYTDDNHSMRPTGSAHVRKKIADWVVDNL